MKFMMTYANLVSGGFIFEGILPSDIVVPQDCVTIEQQYTRKSLLWSFLIALDHE